MLCPSLMLILGVAAAAPLLSFNTSSSPDYNNLTVAIVRAEPARWPMPVMNKNWTKFSFDLNTTVAKAPLLENYIANSLTTNSTHWKSLVDAAVSNNIYVAPAFSHRENNAIYMGQALIDPNGTAFIRHKLRPSGGERNIWSDGTVDGLKVIATPYGRWGLLECLEHFHPRMTFSMQAQVETLHIAAWPYTPDAAEPSAAYWESLEVNLASARFYAVNSNAPLAFASVGNARFLDAQGLDLNVVDADTSTEEVPLVYQSFNTTGLAATVPYAAESEQSWGILRQMVEGFPSYIPKVIGGFVGRKTNLIIDLLG